MQISGTYKKTFVLLPSFLKKLLLMLRERSLLHEALRQEKKLYPENIGQKDDEKRPIKNILVYHISGMFYAGTEKNLQMIANALVEKGGYNVFFMYSRDRFSDKQKSMLNEKIQCIEFSYTAIDQKAPHIITGMSPHFRQVLNENDIDLIITSSSGHSHYPWNVITTIPIILINIFGSPSVQKNIIKTLFISKQIKDYSEMFTGPMQRNEYAYLPVLGDSSDTEIRRRETRARLGLQESDFLFGRIGRAEDALYDPIALDAFIELIKEVPNVYYLIMSPPPIVKKRVEDEGVKNIFFFSDKEDIWDYYSSIDATAHFRFDGETFGLNIAEGMYLGKPVISHVSHIWNAHLEYLTPSFSRIAGNGDVQAYMQGMRDMVIIARTDSKKWHIMKEAAKEVVATKFTKEEYIKKITDAIQSYDEKNF